jgi:hypothetical protein
MQDYVCFPSVLMKFGQFLSRPLRQGGGPFPVQIWTRLTAIAGGVIKCGA